MEAAGKVLRGCEGAKKQRRTPKNPGLTAGQALPARRRKVPSSSFDIIHNAVCMKA